MTNDDIIKLAEFCGLKWTAIGTEFAWKRPDGGLVGIFQPHTDANDCDALIRALNERGYGITIEPWPNECSVAMYSNAEQIADAEFVGSWDGDDYKQGVCELALKVIDEKGA
jgi:hypothetical protein